MGLDRSGEVGVPGRIGGLDGWRAISAGLVILSHLQTFSSVGFVFPLTHYGTLGVEYFFGISGFVIARGLLNGSGGIGAFYIRRVFRILPPLFMYLAMLSLLILAGIVPGSAFGAVRGLIFVCDLPGVNCGGWYGGHLWSLSVEEQFYLVCPFVILLTRSRPLITAAMVAVPVIALLLRVAHLSDAAGFATDFVVIAAGVACAANEVIVLKLINRAPLWIAAVAFAASVAVMENDAKLVSSLLHILLLGPLVMFVLLRTSVGPEADRSWLAAPWLVTLGAATYSIYLFQQFATYHYPFAGPLFYVASVIACIVWGLFSFRFIERPLIEIGRSLAKPRAKAPTPI